MITPHDLEALIELLQRVPMNRPEQLYASILVGKLKEMIDGNENKNTSADVNPTSGAGSAPRGSPSTKPGPKRSGPTTNNP